jgi:hypothetical protein
MLIELGATFLGLLSVYGWSRLLFSSWLHDRQPPQPRRSPLLQNTSFALASLRQQTL